MYKGRGQGGIVYMQPHCGVWSSLSPQQLVGHILSFYKGNRLFKKAFFALI